MLKQYLDEKNVKYEDKMVDQDEEARNTMVEESGGFMGVPFTAITKDDGSKETVIGFDKGKINQILGISED